MKRRIAACFAGSFMIAVVPAMLAEGAWASHESREGKAPLDAAYVAECGSCHVAYPPGLLPADAWQRLMARLDRHYGTNADLEPKQRPVIADFLQRNAGTRQAGGRDGEPRITQADWFLREHRKVEAPVWKRPAVKSPANCGACHTHAESGSYREREIRLPR